MFDLFRRDRPAVPAAAPSAAVPAAVPEAKASASGTLVAWPGSQGRTAAPSRDVAHLTQAGFVKNPIGFRAVRLVAEAAAALPLVLQDHATRYARHPILDLVARPNPAQGRAELLESLYGQLLLTGNAYVEAVGLDAGLPAELHVLRSDRMSVVPGADGWPVAWDYAVGGRKHRYAAGATPSQPSPICHLRSFHPQDDHYGLSALQAAHLAVEVHNGASRWSLALLENAARPSGAIVHTAESPLSQDQFDRLLREMEHQHQGARNAGRPMLLDGGLDWKPMGFSPSDMEFQQTRESAARDIAIAFGVPPMILGIPGDATYANYAEANRAFYRLTVLPLATRVTSALSDWLSDFGADRLTLAPDLDAIPALESERDSAWRRIAEADFLTPAEKRALLGLPALEAPDEP